VALGVSAFLLSSFRATDILSAFAAAREIFRLPKKSLRQSNFLPRPRRVRFLIYPDFRLKLGRQIVKIFNSATRGFVSVVRGVVSAAGRYSRLYPKSDLGYKSDSRWFGTARLVGNKMVNVTIYDEAPQLKVRQCHGSVTYLNWSIKIYIISWQAGLPDIRVIGGK